MHRHFRAASGALILLVLFSASSGLPAQTPGRHPLRTEDSPDPAGPFRRPPRHASEKQRESAARIRLCGQEWRALKASGRQGAQDWRGFSRDCRERQKARGH